MRKTLLIVLLAAAASACSKKNNGTSPVGAWTFVHGFNPATALGNFARPDTALPADYSMTLYGNGNYTARWAGVPSDSGTYLCASDTLYLASLVTKSTERLHYQVAGDSLYFATQIFWGTSTAVYARMQGSF